MFHSGSTVKQRLNLFNVVEVAQTAAQRQTKSASQLQVIGK
jgi:hypothetical protein